MNNVVRQQLWTPKASRLVGGPAINRGCLRGRPRSEESPVSLEDIFEVALKAFATLGYDGVVLRTLNRQLGGSHNLLNGRFGSKEALWYATVDWAFQPLVLRLATAFDPTLTDPLDQLRITMRTFLMYSAERPELLGLMNIEGRQDTARLSHLYNSYIGPALQPVHRLLDHLADSGRTRRVSLRSFVFLLAHGAAAPFTLRPLARHFDPSDPLDPAEVETHADLAADLLVRALERRDDEK